MPMKPTINLECPKSDNRSNQGYPSNRYNALNAHERVIGQTSVTQETRTTL